MIAGSAAWCARILRAADFKLQPGVLLFLTTAIALVELTIQPAEFANGNRSLLPCFCRTSWRLQAAPFKGFLSSNAVLWV